MPNHQFRRGITCPACKALLTSVDRIHRNVFQTLLFPQSKRYKCDSCGLKFSVNPEKRTSTVKKTHRGDGDYELPPITPSSASRQTQTLGHRSQRRTTHLYVTDCPDIPGIRNSAEKLAATRADNQKKDLHKELERLRTIEKKYHKVKKANQYLAKAAAHKH